MTTKTFSIEDLHILKPYFFNFSTLHSDKFIFGFDRVSAKTVNFSTLHSDKFASAKTVNFPANSFGRSPSLRSGEALNSPSSHSGEFSIAYRSENVRRFSNFSSERSEGEDQFSGERPKEFAGKLRLILKISGVWETKTEIGLSYKFIEIYEN